MDFLRKFIFDSEMQQFLTIDTHFSSAGNSLGTYVTSQELISEIDQVENWEIEARLRLQSFEMQQH